MSLGPIEATLKKSTAALERRAVPFLLGGGLACWARGGPESSHDLDLMVRKEDVDRALDALVDAGMRAEQPAEQWLMKAWDGEVLVDLIFEPVGLPITDEVIARGDEISVAGCWVRVMALEDVFATKLLALNEHSLDYEDLVQLARSLREQVDWDGVRARTHGSPFAAAYFHLLREMGIAATSSEPREPGRAEIRVLDGERDRSVSERG
jgi:predicted nucleotidyltransferase